MLYRALTRRTTPLRLASSALVLVALVAAPAAAQPPGERLHTFSRSLGEPSGGLALAPDGTIYGTTPVGGLLADGTAASGVVYALRVPPMGPWSRTVLHAFSEAEGGRPRSGVTLASDGNLYGTTAGHASPIFFSCSNPGACGSVFRLAPDGDFTVLRFFSPGSSSPDQDGAQPAGGLIQAADGHLYGVTSLGQGGGKLYRVRLSGLVETVATIPGRPVGTPAGDEAGNVYVASVETGAGCGSVFRVTPEGAVTSIRDFEEVEGQCGSPGADGLIGAPGGVFYLLVGHSVARLTTLGHLTIVGVIPDFPRHLMRASDGSFLGFAGGLEPGVFNQPEPDYAFRLDAAGQFTKLHQFTLASGGDGYFAKGPLLEAGGLLIGTNARGAHGDVGATFALRPDGVLLGSVPFDYADGGLSFASLTRGADGSFYGTSLAGPRTSGTRLSPQPAGAVYRVTSSGETTILHAFAHAHGASPFGGLVQSPDGSFYGTTAGGGPTGYGTVYRLPPSGALTPVHVFSGLDGAGPASRLVIGTDGSLYGTAAAGGPFNGGTIFRIRPGRFTVLHAFSGGDGSGPVGGLVQGADGHLYGTTGAGGAHGKGVVFRLTLAGAFAVLHHFDGTDGSGPLAGLTRAADGSLVGTTPTGGAHESGVVFRMTTAGAFSLVYAFDRDAHEPHSPLGELLAAPDGSLYGTTFVGDVFRVTLDGTVTRVAKGLDEIAAGLTFGLDGALYGVSFRRQSVNLGSVFRVPLP